MVAVNRIIVDIFRITTQVVGNENYERILPFRESLGLSNETSQTIVGIGESIENFIFEPMIRNVERLMTATGLYHLKVRHSRRLSEIFQGPIEDILIGHTPFAESQVEWEVSIANDLFKARRCEKGAHVGKISVAPVVISQVIARTFHYLGKHWQRFRFSGELHDTHGRLSGETSQDSSQTAVSAETVGIKVSEEHALLSQPIHIDRHIRFAAKRLHDLRRKTLEHHQYHVRSTGMKNADPLSAYRSCVAQSGKQSVGLFILHESVLPFYVAIAHE